MKKNDWHFTENQFLSRTRDNYKKALALTIYTHAVLKNKEATDGSDLDWAMLLGLLNQPYDNLMVKYTEWSSQRGFKKSQTQALNDLLANLPLMAEDWEIEILSKYKKRTPDYVAILPNGRIVFNKGGKDLRINAVKTLSKNLNVYSNLSTVKTSVDDYYTLLTAARKQQLGSKSNVSGMSINVEQARIAAMKILYSITGFLMFKYYDNPTKVSLFFDLQLLRDIRQTVFTTALAISETKALLTRTFVFDDELRIKVSGPGPVSLYLASHPGNTDSSPIIVDGHTNQVVQVSAFNVENYGTNRHITAVNNSSTATHVEVRAL